MYKEYLPLNNRRWLICHKTQPFNQLNDSVIPEINCTIFLSFYLPIYLLMEVPMA